ncbi:Phage integrase, N-terminal SAM-like domain [Saccharopolyspora antimicrobica]|uniref:Integrase-like protein n=1 Tax=Saccharopolyspora antimicrobica TaxID=455193 RepID=A0A1I4QAW8_9PSEU|nr:site-specific integrase [Saccharopolyspora antimicrobica]RKT84853.1 integrase-like protein [Saccharopolyspora antimicrobica]SFM37241.1 Phage integrase, N-terminal SAM-like domain [Saccharopolyspora antimicrobica]
MDEKNTRNPNGRSSIYFGSDGYWHGRVSMGIGDDGKPDRRHVKRKDKDAVVDEVSKLERERDSGSVRKKGQPWTVERWLTHWVENIAPLTCRYKTMRGYQTAVYRHLIPGLGAHRLDRIQNHPEYFEKFYLRMIGSGLKPATVHQVHRTARTAFGEAYKRQHILRNPVSIAKAPRVEPEEIEPLDVEEMQLVIKAALERRNGVRYVIALAIGTRQGESLALKWPRLNRKKRTLRIAKALQRQTWRHGCSDPNRCGAKYHKTKPCKDGCKRHKRTCPPPCPPDCTDHARWCPQRTDGGLVEVDVKSKAGRRTVTLPDELFELILRHEKAQAAEREHAGTEWHDGEWMFTQPNGKPMDPRKDLDDWKEILSEAGVREARLHDARHTAATVLLVLGVPDRVVMELMGWSSVTMKQRYMHVIDSVRKDVADRLNAYFWGTD